MRWLSPILLMILPLPAMAQTAWDAALPDPATVKAPDVTPSSDPKVQEDGYKFYYFHNPAVSFAEAYEDLKQCRGHLVSAGAAKVPGFIPWDEEHRRVTVQGVPMFGLVGVMLGAIIAPKMERGARSNKMRRCMGTRGYERYAIPEATWTMLNEGDERQLVLMQAKLASGPKPQAEAVTK